MTWRLFFLSSTRNKNTGQVLIFRSGGDSPRGWKTARWLRRVTKGEISLLASWMNHIPWDVSGVQVCKNLASLPWLLWTQWLSCRRNGRRFLFSGVQVSSDEWKVFLYPTGQSYRTRFSTVNLLNLSSTARLNSPLKYYLVDTFSFVPFEEEGIKQGNNLSSNSPSQCWAACSQRSCRKKRAIATFDSINVIELRNQWLHGWLEQNSSHLKKWAHQFWSLAPRSEVVVAFFEGMVFWCCGCWSLEVWVVLFPHPFQFLCLARTNVGWFHLECRMDWIHWKRCL